MRPKEAGVANPGDTFKNLEAKRSGSGRARTSVVGGVELQVLSFRRSACTTSVDTNGETSPLRRATSLTRRELRNE